jgi:hypothetical protein
MEEEWIVDRSKLRGVWFEHPTSITEEVVNKMRPPCAGYIGSSAQLSGKLGGNFVRIRTPSLNKVCRNNHFRSQSLRFLTLQQP